MRFPVVLVCLLIATFAGAQHREEGQTRDHEDLDSRYYERYAQQPEQDESQEEFLERADALIRDRNCSSASSKHYRVQSDDPRLDAEAAVRLLDAFRDHFDHFWSGRAALAGYDGQSRVFLFYSFHKFNKLLAGAFRFSGIRPEGHYGSLFDAIMLHTDAGCPGDLGNSLVHEAAHQQLDRRLFAAEESRPPPWLSEGLASYFGYTFQDSSGRFKSSEVGGKRAGLLRDVRRGGCNEIKEALRAGKKAFKAFGERGDSLVEEVVSIHDPAAFYGERVEWNYAASWALVHYLLHGDDGAHADAFAGYLEAAARGTAEPGLLFKLTAMSPGELDAAVERHLKDLKAR